MTEPDKTCDYANLSGRIIIRPYGGDDVNLNCGMRLMGGFDTESRSWHHHDYQFARRGNPLWLPERWSGSA